MCENEDCVCPSTLRNNLFATGNIDNHNPSSTSSRDSFHGTDISITQDTTNENAGVVRIHMETAQNRSQPKGKSLKWMATCTSGLTHIKTTRKIHGIDSNNLINIRVSHSGLDHFVTNVVTF